MRKYIIIIVLSFIYGCVPHHVNLFWSVGKPYIDNDEKIIWYHKNERPFILNRCQEKNNEIECYEAGGMTREVSFVIGTRCQDTCLVEWIVGKNVIWRLQLVENISNGKKNMEVFFFDGTSTKKKRLGPPINNSYWKIDLNEIKGD